MKKLIIPKKFQNDKTVNEIATEVITNYIKELKKYKITFINMILQSFSYLLIAILFLTSNINTNITLIGTLILIEILFYVIPKIYSFYTSKSKDFVQLQDNFNKFLVMYEEKNNIQQESIIDIDNPINCNGSEANTNLQNEQGDNKTNTENTERVD